MINKDKVAVLCFVWAILILLGLAFSLNLPLALAALGTILYLIS